MIGSLECDGEDDSGKYYVMLEELDNFYHLYAKDLNNGHTFSLQQHTKVPRIILDVEISKGKDGKLSNKRINDIVCELERYMNTNFTPTDGYCFNLRENYTVIVNDKFTKTKCKVFFYPQIAMHMHDYAALTAHLNDRYPEVDKSARGCRMLGSLKKEEKHGGDDYGVYLPKGGIKAITPCILI